MQMYIYTTRIYVYIYLIMTALYGYINDFV